MLLPPVHFLLLSSPPSHSRLAGCYVGPVARGRRPGADVVPGRSGCRVHRHEAAILRARRLHALRRRSAHTHTMSCSHNYNSRGSKATRSLRAKVHTPNDTRAHTRTHLISQFRQGNWKVAG